MIRLLTKKSCSLFGQCSNGFLIPAIAGRAAVTTGCLFHGRRGDLPEALDIICSCKELDDKRYSRIRETVTYLHTSKFVDDVNPLRCSKSYLTAPADRLPQVKPRGGAKPAIIQVLQTPPSCDGAAATTGGRVECTA